jgi:hypothetical protein
MGNGLITLNTSWCERQKTRYPASFSNEKQQVGSAKVTDSVMFSQPRVVIPHDPNHDRKNLQGRPTPISTSHPPISFAIIDHDDP